MVCLWQRLQHIHGCLFASPLLSRARDVKTKLSMLKPSIPPSHSAVGPSLCARACVFSRKLVTAGMRACCAISSGSCVVYHARVCQQVETSKLLPTDFWGGTGSSVEAVAGFGAIRLVQVWPCEK